MEYRREIDGLRALAVLPVILFHAGFQSFSGGFVGVDVFFVISGYLITSIIISEKKAGTFSLSKFYERRARRILPPLFLVMFTCIPFAWLWLVPPDFETFSKSLIASTAFASNILFWRTSDYFAPRADLQPLLHTWSLSVEEQYYLLFPILFLLVSRLGRRWTISIVAAAATISLMATEFGSVRYPGGNYFLLPTRAWELLIGVLVALYLARQTKAEVNNPAANFASLVGFLLITYAVLAFNKQIPFPSLYALVPTVGAGLIILFATPRTLVGKLLGARVFVGIGILSYSAYLWHQPLFAFARHRTITEPSHIYLLILSVLTFVLAYFSFKYVEKPFRNMQRFSRSQIFSYSALGGAFFISFAIVAILNHGFTFRTSDRVMAILKSAQDKNPRQAECLTTNEKYIAPDQSCILGNAHNVVGALVGDSHSDALAYSLSKALMRKNVGLRQMSFNGCPPVFNVYRVDNGTDCSAFNSKVFDYLRNQDQLQYLVLVARWTLWLEGHGFDNGEGGVESTNTRVDIVKDGVRQIHNQEERKMLVKKMYVETIKNYLEMGKTVILVYPLPAVGWNVPATLAKMEFLGQNSEEADLTTSHNAFNKSNQETIDVLDSIGSHKNLIVIKPETIFCDSYVEDRCIAQLNGKSLYVDDNHLSISGAGLVIDEVMKHVDFKSRAMLAGLKK